MIISFTDLEVFIILTQKGSYLWKIVCDDSKADSRDAGEMDFEACGQFE